MISTLNWLSWWWYSSRALLVDIFHPGSYSWVHCPFPLPSVLFSLKPCLTVLPLSDNACCPRYSLQPYLTNQIIFCLIQSHKRFSFWSNCPLTIKCACLYKPVHILRYPAFLQYVQLDSLQNVFDDVDWFNIAVKAATRKAKCDRNCAAHRAVWHCPDCSLSPACPHPPRLQRESPLLSSFLYTSLPSNSSP